MLDDSVHDTLWQHNLIVMTTKLINKTILWWKL